MGNIEVGKNLTRSMADQALTAKDVADAAGVSTTTVGNWMSGTTAMKLKDAEAVCDLLGCSLDELAGRDEPWM